MAGALSSTCGGASTKSGGRDRPSLCFRRSSSACTFLSRQTTSRTRRRRTPRKQQRYRSISNLQTAEQRRAAHDKTSKLPAPCHYDPFLRPFLYRFDFDLRDTITAKIFNNHLRSLHPRSPRRLSPDLQRQITSLALHPRQDGYSRRLPVALHQIPQDCLACLGGSPNQDGRWLHDPRRHHAT